MAFLLNMDTIPLDLTTCGAGGFFNRPGAFSKACCNVLNTAGKFTEIPKVTDCPQTRASC